MNAAQAAETTQAAPAAVTTYRGPAVENRHQAHVAVVDGAGRLLYAFGDPHRLTLPRSAVKPAQALAILETGALERFGFDEADLALMCASHNSEDRHIARARAMLAKAHVTEDDMRCGGHPAISDAVQRAWIKRDFAPTPVCSNCSGKHAGMLAAALAMGQPTKDYERPEHPLQQSVKRTLAELVDLDEADIAWGIDGCNLPTPSFALDRLARLFAKLASAADQAARGTPASARDAALARIYAAMTTHPEWVAGDGRFCTALMSAFGGNVVGKVGAEGSYGLGVRAGAHGVDGIDGPLGLAVKMEDGNGAILTAVVTELLHDLGIGTASQRAQLDKFRAPTIRNTVGLEVGRMEVRVPLARQAT
ncbi:asparaginase [Trinickia dinghuensis]|uniref:Asparaginase n=1 Tax=Trinickia dinghuensis TaxID=2291023 RepID=A0A3D8JSS5_9BURK|nr:asparaginase [Trinickia dinghuensis]RDU96088.1 asparaginase [Trinickia dinghuensis]